MTRRNKRERQPGVALYTDDIDDYEYEDIDEEYEEIPKRQRQKRQSTRTKKRARKQIKRENKYNKKQQKKRKKKTPLFVKIIILLLIVQIPMFFGLASTLSFQSFDTKSDTPHTKGILLLGVDDAVENGKLEGHTDSITYIAANFKTKQAVTQPIYRDARILNRCTGQEENINRLFLQSGMRCMAESTSDFLGLPVDYYVIISMEGLIGVVDDLGGVTITPSDSLCSDYGEDGQVYCFAEGNPQKMTGPQTLAYVRYRGATNGESRANRQTEATAAIRDKCTQNILFCYVKVTPHLRGKAQTNIPVTKMFEMLTIFSSKFIMEKQDVIHGTNTEFEDGWTQLVDSYDLDEKTRIIREKIFS